MDKKSDIIPTLKSRYSAPLIVEQSQNESIKWILRDNRKRLLVWLDTEETIKGCPKCKIESRN